jgi:hypothetical protein
MTDIFAHWKRNRFVIGSEFVDHANCILILLTDISFWAEHLEELDQWCSDHLCTVKGMTVEIPNDATLTLFALRWS